MDGRQHRILGAALAASVFLATDPTTWHAAAAAPIAMAFSSGWTSPDGDQSWLSWAPGGHRGLTHWWGLPAAVAYLAHRADLGDVGLVIWAAILGWTSHLVGDFIFGIRPPGIPIAPWGWYVGLRLDSGGWLEKVATTPACLVLVWFAAGQPGVGALAQALARS